MNWDQLTGQWHQIKGEAKMRWAKLTDDDIALIGGNREKLIGKLQERYGLMKEEAERHADSWLESITKH